VAVGLAKGIDTRAHQGALAAGGRTLAVLGHGPDTVYPPENRRLAAEIEGAGALLTDYSPGVGPEAQHFPPRNRIISGLSAGVLVVEAGEQSGALITCRFAADQGRDVFAVPGSITSPASRGCHRLIQDGAKLILAPEDVLEELDGLAPAPGRSPRGTYQMTLDLAGAAGPAAAPEAPPDAEAEPLLRLLAEAGGPAHVDHLARALALPVQAVTGALSRLELEGRVRHVGGMRYVLAPAR
jgi:DNA processing protein